MQFGRVYDAACELLIAEDPGIGTDDVIIPIVAECDDSFLNDARRMQVTSRATSAPPSSRPEPRSAAPAPAEGAVGAGTGMSCLGFKGGIGTRVAVDSVRSHGRRTPAVQLRRARAADGGRRARGPPAAGARRRAAGTTSPAGSCIVVVITDAPLDSAACARLARRAGLGLARTGSTAQPRQRRDLPRHGHRAARAPADDGGLERLSRERAAALTGPALDPFFAAVVEATEEAVLNSMLAAPTVTGRDGNTSYGLPADQVREVLRAERHRRWSKLRERRRRLTPAGGAARAVACANCMANASPTTTHGCATPKSRHSATIWPPSARTTTLQSRQSAANWPGRWRPRPPAGSPAGPEDSVAGRARLHVSHTDAAGQRQPAASPLAAGDIVRAGPAGREPRRRRDRVRRDRGPRAEPGRCAAGLVRRHAAGRRSTSCASGTSRRGRTFRMSSPAAIRAWPGASESDYLFYLVPDELNRPFQVWRHRVGTVASADVLRVRGGRSAIRADAAPARAAASWRIITAASRDTTEVRVIPLAPDPRTLPWSIEPTPARHRVPDRSRPGPCDGHGSLYVVTDSEAEEFTLMRVALDAPGRANWQPVAAPAIAPARGRHEASGCDVLWPSTSF